MKQLKELTYELALSIPEPAPQRFNAGGVSAKKFYSAKIEGKTIRRSSRWWSLLQAEIYEKGIHRTTVGSRVNKKWDEEAACLAMPTESEEECLNRIGKLKKRNIDINMKESAINTWLYGSYHANQV